MKAAKDNTEDEDQAQLTGKVVKLMFGEDSKSEHDALYIKNSTEQYLLRRVGGNAFSDPVLNKLEGKSISVKGYISNSIFFAREIIEEE